MMIGKRLSAGCLAAALLAAGSAQAQFYVRADGALSKTTNAGFVDNDPTTGFIISGNAAGTAPGQFNDFGNGAAVGVGAGTRFSPSGRIDITAAYRKYKLDQSDKFAPPTSFKADLTSMAVMANLYLELAEGRGATPYIGGGLGVSQNRLGDVALDNSGVQGTIPGDTKLGFAWAAMFGFSFPLASHFAIDIAYRFMDLGDVQTKQALTIAGAAIPYSGASGHLRAHELAVGLRF